MITKQELEYLYLKKDTTLQEIAKIKNCSYSTIHRYMTIYQIPRRKPGFKKGTKFSEEHKENISLSKSGSLNPNFGKKSNHPKRCWYVCPNGETVSMRSRWEVAYAEYLDINKTQWLYEPKTFFLKSGAYTPDFLILKSNTYVEIKGWLKDCNIKKMEEFQKENKLLILQKKQLEELGIDLKKSFVGASRPMKKCIQCNNLFFRKSKEQKLCGNKCKNKWLANNKKTKTKTKTCLKTNKTKRKYSLSQKGELNSNSKITESDVIEIISMRKKGKTLKEISIKKNTSMTNVGNIIKGRSWKHVPR